MELFFILLLVVFGLLFLVAELVLLPGVSIGAVLSVVCLGSAIYMSFRDYGVLAGVGITLAVVVLAIVVTIVSLRAKTWQRFSLKQRLHSSGRCSPAEEQVKIGDRGVTVSRLSPMGKVEIGGNVYEAKSQGAYVDPRTPVEVVGFENFTVVVKVTE